MKKLFSITLTTLLVLFASQAFGQETADVTVEAEILDQLNVTAERDIDFGNISAGSNASIDAQDDESGKVSINGAGNAGVLISAATQIVLSGPNDNDINVPLFYRGLENDNQGGSNELNFTSDEEEVTLHETTGDFFLWIGGDFETETTDATGSYSGSVTVEVQYL